MKTVDEERDDIYEDEHFLDWLSDNRSWLEEEYEDRPEDDWHEFCENKFRERG